MTLEEKTVVLAALLHDIGKFSQRWGNDDRWRHDAFTQGFLHAHREYWGESADRLIQLASEHHGGSDDRDALIVQLSDWLSAGERISEERRQLPPHEAALVATVSRMEFRLPKGEEEHYRLCRLSLTDEVVFPEKEASVSDNAYRELWNEFADRFRGFVQDRRYQSCDLTTIYYLLKEYGSRIPAATPWERGTERTVPDVSLFDHSRVACAIAACLVAVDLPTEELVAIRERLRARQVCADSKPFLLLRGDFSGIQSFLFRITRDADARGTSKRLRGRSFYLALLTQVVSDWLRREFSLPIANILFCGGGRFDLLLPNLHDAGQRLGQYEGQLQTWLLDIHGGELGVELAHTPVAPDEFGRFDKVYSRVDDELNGRKQSKFRPLLNEPDFFTGNSEPQEPCRSCELHARLEEGLCEQCETQRRVGEKLPKLEDGFLAFAYGEAAEALKDEVIVPFDEFGVTVGLLDEEKAQEVTVAANGELTVWRINETHDFWLPGTQPVSFGFQFLGNAAPVARKNCQLKPSLGDKVRRGEVLDFEEIAFLSAGAGYLGILKMDVDYLGLVFGIGFDRPSISRLASLSGAFDLFFGGWLNEICRQVTTRWNDQLAPDDFRKDLVDSAFYVVFSGGDDLFIVGPWEQTLWLAAEINKQFRAFGAENPNLRLSGGLGLVKPHYPVQRFADIARDALETAKGAGRDRVHVFGETVTWEEYDELLSFGEDVAQALVDKKLRRSFVYYLLRLHKQHFQNGKEDPLWIPKFHYAVARTGGKGVVAELDLLGRVPRLMRHINVPVSYVSLKTRER